MRVLTEALAVAEALLPAYSHHYSHKKFTMHQLLARLERGRGQSCPDDQQ